MKWKLATIGCLLGNVSFLLSLIVGVYEVDGHYIIDFEKGVEVGIYPAALGIVLIVIDVIMAIKEKFH